MDGVIVFPTIFTFLLAVCGCISGVNGSENLASVVLASDGKTLVVKPGFSAPVVAWGTFRDDINSSG